MKFYISFFLLLIAGCFTPPSKSDSKASSLRIAFQNHPVTIHPRKSGDFTSASLICLLYEGLTRCGPGEMICPGLAHKIDISSDGTIYTFHLRQSVWTDNTPVTAIDFEKSWKKSIEPSSGCLSTYLFFPIKNVEKYIEGKVVLNEVGIRTIDPYTLQVELEKPTPYFLSLTAFPTYLPTPFHKEEKNAYWDQIASERIFNGPFQIDRMVANDEICLSKNETFWNRKDILLSSIQITIVPDETTALQMFEEGELDFIGGPLSPLPPDALQNLENKGRLQLMPMDASTFCTFNTETFPFHNLALRQAFSLAIDREKIIREANKIGQIPALSALPPSFFEGLGSKLPENGLREEITAKAKKLFQQALKELGITANDLENLPFYYKQNQDNQRLVQILQKTWKEAFGISLKLEQLDPKNHLEKLHQKHYQIALASWISQFHDPIGILDRFRSKDNPKNFPNWENEQYIQKLQQASLCIDKDQRIKQLQEAESIFMEDVPIAPLYHWKAPYSCSRQLKNIATTSTGGILFERFKKEF